MVQTRDEQAAPGQGLCGKSVGLQMHGASPSVRPCVLVRHPSASDAGAEPFGPIIDAGLDLGQAPGHLRRCSRVWMAGIKREC